MGGGNASKETVQQQTKQDNTPWAGAQPYYMDLYSRASQAMGQTQNNPFGGQFVAQAGPDAYGGLDALRGNVASGRIGQGSGDFLDMASRTARGDYLSPDTNPFFADTVKAALRPVTSTFMNTVLPAISDTSIAQNAYGGARQDVQQNRAAADLASRLGEISSGMYSQNYQFERGNQMNAGNLLGQGYDLANAPGMQGISIDQLSRSFKDLQNQDQLQRYQNQQQAPWYGLGEMAQILSAGGFGSSDKTTVGDNPNYQDPATQWAKIIMGGLGSAATLGGSQGFNLWGKRA